MNKMISTLVVAMGLGVAGAAMAAPTSYYQTNIKVSKDGTGVDGACVLLNETVTIGASANVYAAYECDEISSIINVAACHEGGSRDAIKCAYTLDANGDPTTVFNANGCSAEGADSTDPDYTAFGASSRGGAMTAYGMGGLCTADTLKGVSTFWTTN